MTLRSSLAANPAPPCSTVTVTVEGMVSPSLRQRGEEAGRRVKVGAKANNGDSLERVGAPAGSVRKGQ